MATSALRGLLLVAALVLGVFVLSRGFPTEAGQPAGTPQPAGGGQTPTEEPPSPEPTETETPAGPQQSPGVEGVRVAVLNGTNEDGLAGVTADQLRRLGYRIDEGDVGNAQASYEVTTLFFRQDSRLEARHLRDTVFQGAVLQRAPPTLDPEIQITVALGLDWAQRN